ncbi:MAG: Maf family protein [Methylophaga sp.]|nr:Maf family protein [Methylophaga sp.]
MNLPPIYLASGSPRRRELLAQIGINFEVLSINIDESVQDDEPAESYVKRVAIDKAKAGLAFIEQQNLPLRPVIAADTAVVVDNQILGKPVDNQQARVFLQNLSGRQHQVLSGVALATDRKLHVCSQQNQVRFAELSDAEIDWYVATGEGLDKAGAYAVQGLAAQFIAHIDGSYSGIMGLPLFETRQLLQEILNQ